MDDRDLDSAALWAAVDSAAAAQASRRDHDRTHLRNLEDDGHRDRGGEVVQPARPFKVPRLLTTPPPPSPRPLQLQMAPRPHSSPNLTLTPDATRLVVVDTPPPTPTACFAAHDLFPAISVANFRKYQEAALSVCTYGPNPPPTSKLLLLINS